MWIWTKFSYFLYIERLDVTREYEENEVSSGVTKVKWNAKVRMRQVKLRARFVITGDYVIAD